MQQTECRYNLFVEPVPANRMRFPSELRNVTNPCASPRSKHMVSKMFPSNTQCNLFAFQACCRSEEFPVTVAALSCQGQEHGTRLGMCAQTCLHNEHQGIMNPRWEFGVFDAQLIGIKVELGLIRCHEHVWSGQYQRWL